MSWKGATSTDLSAVSLVKQHDDDNACKTEDCEINWSGDLVGYSGVRRIFQPNCWNLLWHRPGPVMPSEVEFFLRPHDKAALAREPLANSGRLWNFDSLIEFRFDHPRFSSLPQLDPLASCGHHINGLLGTVPRSIVPQGRLDDHMRHKP